METGTTPDTGAAQGHSDRVKQLFGNYRSFLKRFVYIGNLYFNTSMAGFNKIKTAICIRGWRGKTLYYLKDSRLYLKS